MFLLKHVFTCLEYGLFGSDIDDLSSYTVEIKFNWWLSSKFDCEFVGWISLKIIPILVTY